MRLFFVLICLCFSIGVLGDDVKYLYFTNVITENGMPPTYSEGFVQDSYGFIWFGYEGLTRFDGQSFVTHSSIQEDSSSFISNRVTSICMDDDGNFWLGTKSGFCFFDSERYVLKSFSNEFFETIGATYINDVAYIGNNNILIGTLSLGAYIYNSKSGRLSVFKCNNGDSNTLINNQVRKIVRTNSGRIWLGTSGGLDGFDPFSNTFSHFLVGKDIRGMAVDKDENICVATYSDSVFYVVNGKSGELVRTFAIPDFFRERQKRLLFDSKGNLWIAVLDGGLYILEPDSPDVLRQVRNTNGYYNASINTPMDVFEDSFGNIWITTYNKGVFLMDNRSKPFFLARNTKTFDNFDCIATRYLFRDRDGDIWVGARDGNAFSRYDIRTNEFYTFLLARKNLHKDDLVISMTDGDAGQLFIGTVHSGLCLFDKNTHDISSMEFDTKRPERIKSNTIYALLNDANGNLWIGYGNNGVDIYNRVDDRFTHFEHISGDANSLSDNNVRVIFKDSFGCVWIGTYNGLNRFIPEKMSFENYLSVKGDSTTLIDNMINCIHEDKYGNLWVGTHLGFNLFDRNRDCFVQYGASKGFEYNTVLSILSDNNDNLWINAEKGICKFNIINSKFRGYSKGDGLQGSLFYGAACKAETGELLFGGINGINIFKPEQLYEDSVVLPIFIVDFKIFNQSVAIGDKSIFEKNIFETDSIILNYYQTVFSIDYTTLNYGSSANVKYSYRLVGFEKNWNFVGAKRSATYTNIAHGHYVFEVKSTNNDGVWNNTKVRRLFISVLPPPWKTWWAYLIYITVLIVIVFFVFHYYSQFVYEEKERELDQMKLRFFMNLSHEFRTPLSLILNPVDSIEKTDNVDEIHRHAKIIKRSASRLLNLVNQLLNLRKMEVGKIGLNLISGDILRFSKDVFLMFEDLAKYKNIKYSFESVDDEIIAFYDPDVIEKVLTNLLSNAIKYTQNGGVVTFLIRKNVVETNIGFMGILGRKHKKDIIEIRVIDNGIGFTKEHLKNVFSRFFTTDSTKTGIGIGLNFTKSLVDLMGGEIFVESAYKKGTTFTVQFPVISRFIKNKVDGYSSEHENYKFDSNSVLSAEYFVAISNDDSVSESNSQMLDNVVEIDAKPLLLFVEDNKELRLLLKNEFSNQFRIKEAVNGVDGFEKINKYYPDIVVSDVMMPIMDGFEMCKKIKSNIDTCHIPIILLTARSMEEDRIEGYRFGADAYLGKPFTMAVLHARINNLLEARRRLREKFAALSNVLPSSEMTTNSLDEAFLDKATKVLLDNIENIDFGLDDLIIQLNVSRSQFFRKITSLTGQNPSNFMRTIRLKYAAQLLLRGDSSVKEIAYRVGFSSPAYFSKTFRELFNQTPIEYIQNNLPKP